MKIGDLKIGDIIAMKWSDDYGKWEVVSISEESVLVRYDAFYTTDWYEPLKKDWYFLYRPKSFWQQLKELFT